MISAMQKTQTESRNPVIKWNLQFNVECHGMCQSLDEFIKIASLYVCEERSHVNESNSLINSILHYLYNIRSLCRSR